MQSEADLYLLWSAQRALLGQVTLGLRSVSFDRTDRTISALAVFEREPDDEARGLVSDAFGEVIADYVDETLDEKIIVSAADLRSLNLRLLAYQRHEPAGGQSGEDI